MSFSFRFSINLDNPLFLWKKLNFWFQEKNYFKVKKSNVGQTIAGFCGILKVFDTQARITIIILSDWNTKSSDIRSDVIAATLAMANDCINNLLLKQIIWNFFFSGTKDERNFYQYHLSHFRKNEQEICGGEKRISDWTGEDGISFFQVTLSQAKTFLSERTEFCSAWSRNNNNRSQGWKQGGTESFLWPGISPLQEG